MCLRLRAFLCWGCQACRSVFVKFFVKFDLEFDLKFEISDEKNLVKFWGRTFLPARKARNISGRISGRISDQNSNQISFQISRLSSTTSFSRRAVLILCVRSLLVNPFFLHLLLRHPESLGSNIANWKGAKGIHIHTNGIGRNSLKDKKRVNSGYFQGVWGT